MTRKLAAILGAGLVLRVAYVALQPRFDLTYSRPVLDGAVYVALARALASGESIGGAYYMPPLYPWVLSVVFRLFGDAWTLLFLAQHLAVVAAAGLLAIVARKVAGEAAGLATAAVALLYHPSLFFASRPLGEALALLLLASGLVLASRQTDRSGIAAGLAVGAGSLVRPNFLPMAPIWAARELAGRNLRRAALIVGATVVAILPAIWHNYAASGRLVPVSANGGVVFWLGNAPGAVGFYTPVPGFKGSLDTQQEEAIAEASARSERQLDAVASDGFWWREGLRVRASDPVGTLILLLRKALLTIDNSEHGLDYAPALDANPVRFAAPLPFALLLGLAVFGLASRGFARTGGFPLWSAALVAAATPIVFYASSRHRLPVAFLLAVPAGAGIAGLTAAKRIVPYAAGLAAIAVSLAVPSGDNARSEKAWALSVLAEVQLKSGELDAAAETARSATELDGDNAVAWFNRGVIEAAKGDSVAAERAYRAALTADPLQPEAAGNLAGILVRTGRATEAPAPLERALAAWPRHAVGWTNLVVAYAAAGETARAKDAVRRAEERGVKLDPGLVKAVEGVERP